MSQAVIINQVTKKFGKPLGPFWKRVLNGRSPTNAHKHNIVAVDQVSFTVQEGEILGRSERYAKRMGKLHRNG